MEKLIYEINTDDIMKPDVADDLITTRLNMMEMVNAKSEFKSDVTITVQAWNRLDKTKQCIDSILKYTSDVDYDLILIDSGSSDGTFEYFKTVEHDKVRILRLTKNITTMLPAIFINSDWYSKYIVTLANDIIVTKNWLSNMIKVAESDPKIGIVTPMTSNASNFQSIDLGFTDFDDMQKKAANFNIPDPKKWHERLRIVTLGTMYKKDFIMSKGFPINDIGSAHDFSDDDIAFQARRLGYKVVLAGDTWIHHNHEMSTHETRTREEIQKSLYKGRENFKEKYFGIDAWDDVNEYIPHIIPAIGKTLSKEPKILGIDVKCGTQLLEIKNAIRKHDKFKSECFAYTQDAKYFLDLQTFCGEKNVYSGDINAIRHCFKSNSFDYIILGTPINRYSQVYEVLNDVLNLLNKGGQLFVTLKNTSDIMSLFYTMGRLSQNFNENFFNISIDQFYEKVESLGYSINIISVIQHNASVVNTENINYIRSILEVKDNLNMEKMIKRIIADRYIVEIKKI